MSYNIIIYNIYFVIYKYYMLYTTIQKFVW